MEIQSKELKLIALEVNQFENRHFNNIKGTFLHVQLNNIPIQGTQSNFVQAKKLSERWHRHFRLDRQIQKWYFCEF